MHIIDTGDAAQVATAPYRTSPENRAEMHKQIEEMVKQGVVSPSRSPWASPVVLVPKKDGTIRFAIDYRKLNEVTKKEVYALSRIDDTLDALGGAKFFTTLDLTSGYWQVDIALKDRPKSAFVTHEGQWEFHKMPFGLTNAPATFQRMMNNAFAGLTWQCCLVYLDDIIIFSKDFDDHLRDLALVFQRIEEHGLKLKPKKCHVCCNEVEYLGHIISDQGVRADPKKIEAVSKWPVPKNVTDVQSFLGLCGYYRRLIKDFARIEAPLRRLTKKGALFFIGPLELQAFETLKAALVADPVMAMPDFSGKYVFEVHTDACDTGIGAVLSQKG